jgi:hypothetical protein
MPFKRDQFLLLTGGGARQITAGCAPDIADGSAGTDEQSCGRERDESEQQGVFDEILPLLVA